MYSENGQALVSAVLSINALDKAIHLVGETQPLSLLELPYPLPEIGED